MFDHIKYLIIEYLHLLIPFYILFKVYTNNSPINFKLAINIPETLSKENAAMIGITDPESKLYEFVSYLYGILRSFLSLSFKSGIFVLIMIAYIIEFIFNKQLGNADETGKKLIFAVVILVFVFYILIGVPSILKGYYNNSKVWTSYLNFVRGWLKDIDVEKFWDLFNFGISTGLEYLVYYIFNESFNKGGEGFWKNPVIPLFVFVISVLLMYFRIDGMYFLIKEGLWEKTMVPFGKKWWKNMTEGENVVSQWIYFGLYILLFIVTIYLHYSKKDFEWKKYFLLNNLINSTNHPILVLVIYIYVILLRTDYNSYWLKTLGFLNVADIAYIKFNESEYGQNLINRTKGIVSSMPSPGDFLG